MNILVKRLHSILPIFQIKTGNRCVLYTPGHLTVVKPDVVDAISQAWNGDTSPDEITTQQVAAWLQTRAEQTFEQWQQWVTSPFAPESLTIYLSNRCNLACPYCYVSKDRSNTQNNTQDFPVIQENVVRSAARLVAQHCATQDKPFYVVLHGGGEPALHWELVERIESLTRQIAFQFDIEWFGYIATNGVFSEKKARWLANHFDLIGLSCDGPPDIQDRQRPLQGGKETSHIVERTARIIRESGGSFEVRTTITPQTAERQREIVKYLHEQLRAETIRFEPVYQVRGGGKQGFVPNDAELFVGRFLEAQKEAQARGIELSFSGIRLHEIHSSYCDILRNVLHLNPDGTATACFFSTDGRNSDEAPFVIGRFAEDTGEFVLNRERIETHKRRALEIPKYCYECLNVYHCARGCPEFCSVNVPHTSPFASFRCQIHQQLAQAWILQAAEQIVADNRKPTEPGTSCANEDVCGTYKSPRKQNSLLDYLNNAPARVDIEAILRQWEAVKSTYRIEDRRMPSPVWVERGFEHGGAEAWQRVVHHISQNSNHDPMSIYIHVPFCDRRCKFCDCYSMPLGKRNRRAKEEQYLQTLLSEMEAWSHLPPLRHRSVTTIHFGGGTPNCLSPNVFERIIRQCQQCFHTTPKTEWALESTSSLLTGEHLTQLKEWGFTRLHIGVQTLEEPLRHTIGRRENADVVIRRILRSLEMGFITSVDVIYGLPGQTLHGLIDTLDRLCDVSIYGVSLYRLNVSSRNRKFLEKQKDFNRDAVYDYILFQAADHFLIGAGYSKNHFTHFARSEDRNLYYNHAKRGEDLLAMGPTADGVFGSYHYRHPEYNQYVIGADSDVPVLEGGVRETPLEQWLRPAIAALMTGSLSRVVVQELKLEPLLENWIGSLLLKEDLDTGSYILTANGSWLVDEMITELKNSVGGTGVVKLEYP